MCGGQRGASVSFFTCLLETVSLLGLGLHQAGLSWMASEEPRIHLSLFPVLASLGLWMFISSIWLSTWVLGVGFRIQCL